uniref:protein EXECUTER 1, chloroplastic-like n=1 Tax=Erigeron canadensis TaxID=72917 RepID=UPI001CB91925|nr:protein EXECUTER 1, chloroplastic-like [Erigeron canadensis]
MASISPPPTFPFSDHKLTFTATPIHSSFNLSTTNTLFSKTFNPPIINNIICRCQNNNNNNNNINNNKKDDEDPNNNNGWDYLLKENVDNVVKWFNQFISTDKYSENAFEKGEYSNNDKDSGDEEVKEDWNWERWTKHFNEIDEQERIVSILKSQLSRAVVKEDYEDAARIKVAIAAASTNDIVGRVMSQLKKAIKEERYKDAAFVRDYANAGLVGWWAGFSDDSKDPYGRIIRISAEHGRYLARSYSPRQLAKATDGAPLFELFITMDEKGDYRQQAVYLKRVEGPQDFPIASSLSPSLITKLGTVDSIGDKDDILAKDSEDADGDDSAEEFGFENILRDMIPGAKDVKIKVMNVTSPEKIDRDFISKVVEQIMEEEDVDEDEDDEEEEDDTDEVKDETGVEQYDIDIDIDTDNTIIDGEVNNQIAVKVVVGGLVQKVSNETSHKDLIRVPAKLEKKNPLSFTFSIEKEREQLSSSKAQSLKEEDAKVRGSRNIDSVMLDLAKSIGRGKIPMKVLKDVNQLINLSLSQAQNRQLLSGSTTFNRIELPSTQDPLNGLYVGAHGIYISEVIHLKRKFGQWQENGNMKNLEFYEYVEAVKITGDPYVPAGQVAFRAKIGTKYQLPHRGIIPEEFGVIARYRGQGRLADPGFKNPRWVDGELVILDGKYINGGLIVGFVYWAPESHFLVFFNQLRLKE